MLGAETVDDKLQNADHNTNVFDLDGNEQGFYTYLKNFKQNLENHYIQEVYKTQFKRMSLSKDVIGSMATKFLYYIGALTIYKRICDYRIEDFTNMEKFDKCWNIKISDVLEFYLNHNLDKSNRTTLKKIDIIRTGNIIMCELLNSAKDKYIITK